MSQSSELHEAVTFPIVEGAAVYTTDGNELGAVKAVRDAAFKIDAPMRPDYWLSRATVLSTTPERITVNIESSNVAAFQLSEEQATSPDSDPNEGLNPLHKPIILDEDEQQAQRERMERELAEQRKGLPSA